MSAICADCGKDTTPCTGKRGCRHAGRWEYYMVRDSIWAAAGMKIEDPYTRPHSGFLCIGCLERRLGRTLTRGDFKFPEHDHPWDTPRLAERRRAAHSFTVKKRTSARRRTRRVAEHA